MFHTNKNKVRTFWGWKPSKNKYIESHQNFTGSYKKSVKTFHASGKEIVKLLSFLFFQYNENILHCTKLMWTGLRSITTNTVQKMKFSITDFVHSFLRVWSHFLKESLMKNFIFIQYWWYCSLTHFTSMFHFYTPFLYIYRGYRNKTLVCNGIMALYNG